MKLMIIGNIDSPESREFLNILGKENCAIYAPGDSSLFEDQKNFSSLYSERPEYIINLKIKIPYFYTISGSNFKNELEYYEFNKYYSQLGGASAVFVANKTLNMFANWLNLNSFWTTNSVDTVENPFKKRKFITSQIHIGYVYDNNMSDWGVIKNTILSKRSNWVFHLYAPEELTKEVELNSNIHFETKEQVFNNSQILLVPGTEYQGMLQSFPSPIALEALSKGCALISGNFHGNNNHLLFDKVHYFRLDNNNIIETIQYAEKRREKLERMAHLGGILVRKYFDVRDVVRDKLGAFKNFYLTI